MTLHNEAKKEDIANIVIMPGDPLRAKYIAENFLEDYKLVNSVRGMFAYTGFYKGKRLTVMAHGMGMPSIGIYCYELYKFYDVDTIIRIGSCGIFTPDVKTGDTILVNKSYTEGNFSLAMNNEICHTIEGTLATIDVIKEVSRDTNIPIIEGTILCNEYFDPYIEDIQKLFDRLPKELNILGSEMESFALYYTAHVLNKNAACLLTVTDSMFENKSMTPEERQTSLNNMIKLALESSLKM